MYLLKKKVLTNILSGCLKASSFSESRGFSPFFSHREEESKETKFKREATQAGPGIGLDFPFPLL